MALPDHSNAAASQVYPMLDMQQYAASFPTALLAIGQMC